MTFDDDIDVAMLIRWSGEGCWWWAADHATDAETHDTECVAYVNEFSHQSWWVDELVDDGFIGSDVADMVRAVIWHLRGGFQGWKVARQWEFFHRGPWITAERVGVSRLQQILDEDREDRF